MTLPKKVTFSDEPHVYFENPNYRESYRLSRINPFLQFKYDITYRYTPMLDRILQSGHRDKMKKYLESKLEQSKII